MAPVALYLLRASFGAALIASVALIFTTILVASSSRDRDDRDSRSSRGFGGGDFFMSPLRIFGPSPFDLFFYDPYRPLGPNRYVDGGGGGGGPRMSFLEAVFSFLFGDGDPNEGLEARRTRAIAQAGARPPAGAPSRPPSSARAFPRTPRRAPCRARARARRRRRRSPRRRAGR